MHFTFNKKFLLNAGLIFAFSGLDKSLLQTTTQAI